MKKNQTAEPRSFPSNSFLLKLVIQILIFNSCSVSKKIPEAQNDPDLAQFASLLYGRFSNAGQAAQDTAFFHISLVMTPIWPERTDGLWLYVEQAMAAKPEKPYRQRVYKLTHPSSTTFVSEIYTIKNAQDVIGLQTDQNKKQLLKTENIERKDGCEVTLRYKNGRYEGGTRDRNCPSDLRGASYATSTILLKPDEMTSWDQGFDKSGKQVWGSTKGGYVFVREK